MAFILSDMLNGLLKGGWNFVKNTGEGVIGNRSARIFETGEKAILSPRERLIEQQKRLRMQAKTGHKIEGHGSKITYAGHEIEDEAGNIIRAPEADTIWKRGGNRVGAGVESAANMTVGNLGLALGWGIRKSGQAVGKAAAAAAKPTARAVGHVAYQAGGLAKDTIIGGGHILHRTSQNWAGGLAMFGAAAAAPVMMAGFESSEHYAVNHGIAEFAGQELDAIAGAVTPARRSLQTFGADGNMVFAMHNQR